MEIMQIWLWIGAVSNSQRGKRSLFTSECSKHCIIFISASHTLLCESNSTQRKMPSLSSGNPDSPLSLIYLLFFFPPLLLRDQGSRCNTYYRGFQDLRISWRWLEINLHNPSPLFLLFNLGSAAKWARPERGATAISKKGMTGGVRRLRNLWSRGVWSDPCSFLITKVPPLSAAHKAPGLYGESVCFHTTRMHQNNNLWIINIMLKWQSLWAYLGYDLQHQEMKHLLDLCEDGTGYTHVTLIAHIVHAVRSTTAACRSVLHNFYCLKSEVVGRFPTQHR